MWDGRHFRCLICGQLPIAVTSAARCRPPPPRCTCRCNGCSILQSPSVFHSPGGSTELTLSPYGRRLRDFDDETFACDGSSRSSDNDINDVAEGSERVCACLRMDHSESAGNISSRKCAITPPIIPPPCTDNESASFASSTDCLPAVTGRHSAIHSTNTRSPIHVSSVAHAGNSKRRCQRAAMANRSPLVARHRDESDILKRTSVDDGDSSSSGLGSQRRCYRHSRRRRSKTRPSRCADRRHTNSRSSSVHGHDGHSLLRSRATTAADCPPPSPSSDYIRLNFTTADDTGTSARMDDEDPVVAAENDDRIINEPSSAGSSECDGPLHACENTMQSLGPKDEVKQQRRWMHTRTAMS